MRGVEWLGNAAPPIVMAIPGWGGADGVVAS